MTISRIRELLDAKVLCCPELLSKEVKSACGADMMSDVLAFVKDQALLLTGLINPQVVRTAEMMDIACICFVRGKEPNTDLIDLAAENGIVLLTTSQKMFPACGILYSEGLSGNVDGNV